MPPLVIHVFWPLRTHSSFASSYTARVFSPETSDPASGSLTQNAASASFVGRPEALRHPLHDLLGRAVAEDARNAERGAHDGEADAGIAPEQLLVEHRHHQPGRVREGVRDEVERVQADLRRLLDDRPRGLLPLVPLVGGRTDDVLGEVVDPLLDLELVLVESEGEIGHCCYLRGEDDPPARLPKLPVGNLQS